MASLKSLDLWKPGLLAAVALVFITSLPQLYLCYARGSMWNGSYAYLDTDEFAYAAYTNALLDGRPRRNDPYTGHDNQSFETPFSIQFIPPYALSWFSRLLNISPSMTFVLLVPLVVISSTLIIFKLVVDVTENPALAAASAIGVLCLSTLVVHEPVMVFFPFLRRYVPAFPFPICFAMFLFVWKSLTIRTILWPFCAAVAFVFLIYSYFFFWTAAAAWLCALMILWIIARPKDRKKTVRVLGIIASVGALGLMPYLWLLSHRANTTDSAQVLEMTRVPDLFRTPEIYGGLVLLVLAYLAHRGRIAGREPGVLFAASFALAPFLIFNQHVVTGRSLQPFHYEQFIADYMVVLATFLLVGMAWRKMPRLVPVGLAFGGLSIGLVFAVSASRVTLQSNILIDEARSVALHLKKENTGGLVFTSNTLLTSLIPTEARNPVLWARYSYVFGDITPTERKKSFYQHLYYSGFDEARLVAALQTDFTTRVEFFGAERANPLLTSQYQPITMQEVNAAAREYVAFGESFDRSKASNPILFYAIVSARDNLSNLDRWYRRDAGAGMGEFIIYRLSLRE